MKLKSIIFRYLIDLKAAIYLLLLISFLSSIGTVIEQNQTIDFYKNAYPIDNYFFNWEIIKVLGFDQIYQTWWFIALLILLGVQLLGCTFLQQFPALNLARRCYFYKTENQLKKLSSVVELDSFNTNSLLNTMLERDYTIFQQSNLVYAYKGIIGRFGPIIVHISMLFILIGSIIGSLCGFTAQELVPETEIFRVQNLIASNVFTQLPKFSNRVNDFWITYDKTNRVKQFYTDLSVLDESGIELKRETIYVNHPLTYQGITWYQTDWNLIGFRARVNGTSDYQVPFFSPPELKKKLWISWLPITNDFKNGLNVVVDNFRSNVSFYNKNGDFIETVEIGDKLLFEGNTIQPIDLSGETGLQIKSDPGIFLIYLGFALLMVSTLISYLSYSQLWFLEKNSNLFIGGFTNRAKLNFETEFLNLFLPR
jgi:cytochrome c biogenesis protein